jgi:hypothetical protein
MEKPREPLHLDKWRFVHWKTIDTNAKAVPLHATMALVGRGYSPYSLPTSVLDGVSGERHAPAAL